MVSAEAKSPPRVKELSEVLEVLARANRLRTNELKQSLGMVKWFAKTMEEAGFDYGNAISILSEGFHALDIALPEFLCPWCEVRGGTAHNCHCRGRGWFTKNQMAQYTLAKNKATLIKAGYKNGFGDALTKIAKAGGNRDS